MPQGDSPKYLLCNDPGTATWSWVIVTVPEGEIVDSGTMPKLMEGVSADNLQWWIFHCEQYFTDIVAKMGAKGRKQADFHVGFERYQTRGHASVNNEKINLLIGAYLSVAAKYGAAKYHPVMPSSWKTRWNNVGKKAGADKDPWYALVANASPLLTSVHRKDAYALSLYLLDKEFGQAHIEGYFYEAALPKKKPRKV